jgi:hypothetical protein
MRLSKLGVLSAVSGLALLAGTGVALAKSTGAKSTEQVFPIAPGVKLVVTSQGLRTPVLVQTSSMPVLMPIMPNPFAMMQQIAQTLTAAQQSLMQESFMPVALPTLPRGASAVVITSFSNGRGTYTQRIVYPADGGAPQVHVSTVGDARNGDWSKPAVLPETLQLRPVTVPSAVSPRPRLVLADDATN